jgi:hypothetical protein
MLLQLSPAAYTRRCQLPSATGKPGRIRKKPAPGMRDRYHPGSLASERPVLVVRWGLLSMVVRSLSLSVSCAGVNSWVDAAHSRLLRWQEGPSLHTTADCTAAMARAGSAANWRLEPRLIVSRNHPWLRPHLRRDATPPGSASVPRHSPHQAARS